MLASYFLTKLSSEHFYQYLTDGRVLLYLREWVSNFNDLSGISEIEGHGIDIKNVAMYLGGSAASTALYGL